MSCIAVFLAGSRFEHSHVERWARLITKICRCDIEIKGLDNLPTEGHLILFNHLSLLDIPIIYSAIGGKARFGAKAELFKIPVFGLALKRFGFLQIERKDRAKTLATYQRTAEQFRQGKSFLLAPEGTRQKELAIGPFKSGPFILAIENTIPIVALVSAGQEKIVPKGRLIPNLEARHKIAIEILPLFSTKDYCLANKDELKFKVREDMIASLEKLKGSLDAAAPIQD